jgi:hypothetical protein
MLHGKQDRRVIGMTRTYDNKNNILKAAYHNVTRPEPSLEFIRQFYDEHCNEEERAWIDALVLAVMDNVHRKYDGPFSPANALEILGALVVFREETRRPMWQPAITSADVQARRVRNVSR